MNDYKTDLRNIYNTIADHFSKTRSFIWPELKAFLPYIPEQSHVIDIGCGNGRLIELLASKSCTYLGIDQAEDLLYEAKQKWPNYTFERADMTLYHYGSNRFDCAFFIASLHHLASNEEQIKVLKRVHRALNPQGKLFITVWNMWQAKYRKYIMKSPYHHSYVPYTAQENKQQRFYYAFTKTELITTCKKSGFRIIEAWYSNKEAIVARSEARNLCIIAEKL
ncbi:MAG: class I SAM-dependent methyltransferase [Candidatus Abawacabacteria bacterium]|nr:class I SAM-dependent methyltransferase [Candidatus Abawacabacteria bacterium]